MTTYVKISAIERYPDLHVSRQLTSAIQRDGLITPILMVSESAVHKSSQERSEAFIREIESLKAQGIDTTDSIIVVYWHELDTDEQEEYS